MTTDEITTLQRWPQQGTHEGDTVDLPAAPRRSAGWELGEPDLVVAMPESYTLVADGPDVSRDFVIPVKVDRPRWVETVELQPGNRRVVRHAVLVVDGRLFDWSPGRVAPAATAGMAWRLEPGDDLVLRLRLSPSGESESVRPAIGLRFTDRPPSLHPSILTLSIERERRFTLPVPVELTQIYPRLRSSGKRISVEAERPDGTEDELLRIDDWDPSWQEVYRYVEPVALPAGTTIVMRTDEIGSLTLQLLARDAGDRAKLETLSK